MLTPPALVTVREPSGPRSALLLATRGERSYVQVSRGVGANHLVWVGSAQVDSAQVDTARVCGGPGLR
jgi:hypothetical protein